MKKRLKYPLRVPIRTSTGRPVLATPIMVRHLFFVRPWDRLLCTYVWFQMTDSSFPRPSPPRLGTGPSMWCRRADPLRTCSPGAAGYSARATAFSALSLSLSSLLHYPSSLSLFYAQPIYRAQSRRWPRGFCQARLLPSLPFLQEFFGAPITTEVWPHCIYCYTTTTSQPWIVHIQAPSDGLRYHQISGCASSNNITLQHLLELHRYVSHPFLK